MLCNILNLSVILIIIASAHSARYEPNWDSIDSRPLPTWYDESKFGIFIHWGVFSVPSYISEWFWYYWKTGNKEAADFMKKNYPPDFTYPDFAAQFTAELYDPVAWADLFKRSGAKYVVLTSKHHEGFTNWNSSVSFNWNSMDVGPKRNLVGDLAAAIRSKTDLHFGVYHSLFEWFNPVYLGDKANAFKTRNFVTTKTMPELYELVNYFKPDVIWSDGDAGPDSYWNSTEFLAWLYNDSPVKDSVVVNDRWCDGCSGKHGGYYSFGDRFNPGVLEKHKWENCMTIDKGSWGYRREASLSSYMSVLDLITTLAETISCGGNLLMNVGPTHDGRILPIFEERLTQMGDWLKVNGEAIYSSKPWIHQNDTVTPGIWYTSKSPVAYAILLKWPTNNTLLLGAPTPTSTTKVSMLGYSGEFNWKPAGLNSQVGAGGMSIGFPSIAIDQIPSPYAWVLKLENLAGSDKVFRGHGLRMKQPDWNENKIQRL